MDAASTATGSTEPNSSSSSQSSGAAEEEEAKAMTSVRLCTFGTMAARCAWCVSMTYFGDGADIETFEVKRRKVRSPRLTAGDPVYIEYTM